jgi:sortase (surface protein transpeptidase)
MLMFEYEYLLEDIKTYNKQQEEQRKKDEKANNYKTPNVSQMMSSAQASIPKISVPKF